MVTKEQLKDWQKEAERKAWTQEGAIEFCIDEMIKQSVCDGENTIFIGNMVWKSTELSRNKMNQIRSNIIAKYQNNGFDVKEMSCGDLIIKIKE